MSKGRVPQVVSECCSLNNIFVDWKLTKIRVLVVDLADDGRCDLRYF